ncbi:kinesin-like nuclear fusion protein [Malassezia sp. CBS 17886]|nr:kinesin-like nuclear fusion protein [Malassezia sp. CBS 17886]
MEKASTRTPAKRGISDSGAGSPAVRAVRHRQTVLANATNTAAAAGATRASSARDTHESEEAMRILFSRERERVQRKQSEEDEARATQRRHAEAADDALRREREDAHARESGSHAPGWRGYNDYEVALLQANFARVRGVLEDEVQRLRAAGAVMQSRADHDAAAVAASAHEAESLRTELRTTRAALARHDDNSAALRSDLAETRARNAALEQTLRDAESVRRRLHNQVQELRGNVRVFARVRPSTDGAACALLRFPDTQLHTQLEVCSHAESATGQATVRTQHFTFDHVFPPAASQAAVFEEVSALMQSVLDGYNTTIFAYGQTGSGKTHTLEGTDAEPAGGEAGGVSSDAAGLIPRAISMLWREAARLAEQGWVYTFDAQMLQIYLDQIYDLLGAPDSEQEKHEVRHTDTHTTVTNVVSETMQSPAQVFALLARAKRRRHVAATRMNARSSRSHSVFTLRVRGRNEASGETTDASLNLVDLA